MQAAVELQAEVDLGSRDVQVRRSGVAGQKDVLRADLPLSCEDAV